MIGNAPLPADHNVIFHDRTARESALRSDDHIFPNLYVMPDMYQIVDLRASPDAGHIQGAAINSRVSSDLDVVFNFQSADLRELLIASGLLIAHIAESVTPQHRARVNNRAAGANPSRGCAKISPGLELVLPAANSPAITAEASD